VFSSLPSKEIERIIPLLQVLKQIDCDDDTPEAKRVAYQATNYLECCLKDLEKNYHPLEIAEDGSASPSDGVWLHTQIASLNPNRKREVIELGHFLQSDFFTSERVEKLKMILRSYLSKLIVSKG